MGVAYYVMGVSGCGKSTLGQNLANHLSLPFYDADSFHPKNNIEKMQSGIPLTDEDRVEWLDNIQRFVEASTQQGSLVFACSALKERYRTVLSKDINAVWVFMDGNFDEIEERMKKRKDHYMPASLLQSQFDALEKPTEAIRIPVSLAPEKQLEALTKQLR